MKLHNVRIQKYRYGLIIELFQITEFLLPIQFMKMGVLELASVSPSVHQSVRPSVRHMYKHIGKE